MSADINMTHIEGETKLSVGFIGCGNMAQALAGGIIKAGKIESNQVWASAPSTVNSKKLKEIGCNTTQNNVLLVKNCQVVFLCVKPHLVDPVLKELQDHFESRHLIISVVAGVTLETIEIWTPQSRIIRVMPNTPCLVGEGVCAYIRGRLATPKDGELVDSFLSSVGICEEVKSEQLMDPICGLSGSGPAFIYTTIQAMSDGGVKMGLPRNLATRFAAQTVLGAAKMVLETCQHPDVLKDNVCSPGGTTIHGIHALEASGVRTAFINAVEAATNRARELGKK